MAYTNYVADCLKTGDKRRPPTLELECGTYRTLYPNYIRNVPFAETRGAGAPLFGLGSAVEFA